MQLNDLIPAQGLTFRNFKVCIVVMVAKVGSQEIPGEIIGKFGLGVQNEAGS